VIALCCVWRGLFEDDGAGGMFWNSNVVKKFRARFFGSLENDKRGVATATGRE
jgi:hypothetical protein